MKHSILVFSGRAKNRWAASWALLIRSCEMPWFWSRIDWSPFGYTKPRVSYLDIKEANLRAHLVHALRQPLTLLGIRTPPCCEIDDGDTSKVVLIHKSDCVDCHSFGYA